MIEFMFNLLQFLVLSLGIVLVFGLLLFVVGWVFGAIYDLF